MAEPHVQHPQGQHRDAPAHPAGGHEVTDISLLPVLSFLGALVVTAIIVHIGMGGMMELFERHETGVAATDEWKSRLQVNPAQDWADMRDEDETALDAPAFIIDEKAGLARIPIRAAMAILAEQGLPTRSAPPQGGTHAGAK